VLIARSSQRLFRYARQWTFWKLMVVHIMAVDIDQILHNDQLRLPEVGI
jgi:hypothetical protein